MLSANRIRAVKALQNKKNRQERGLFVVEGAKTVQECLHSDWKIAEIFSTEAFLRSLPTALIGRTSYHTCTPADLERMGSFQSNDAALAVLEMKSWGMLPTATKGLTLALDTVNDPGNLGTILRLADWYACDAVICSPETADMYNPKTIAASKGSFLRMPVYYTSLDEWLPKVTVPVYAALLQSASVHYATLETPAILLMGNEANGIRPHLLPLVQHPISIPRFGHAESLNVASAAAILVDRFMSRHHPPS